MQLESVKKTAKRFNLSERRVQKLCETGRIEGAKRISNVWLIPASAKKPSDERLALEHENLLSLSELCSDLSISIATGRNWLKLGKLIPTESIKGKPFFSKDYASTIKKDILEGKNKALKSRRNKKFISGNAIYNSYVSLENQNLSTIQALLDTLLSSKTSLTESVLACLIADCAKQLLRQKVGKENEGDYEFLVEDLLSPELSLLTFFEEQPELSGFQYEYEEGEDILGLLYISLKNVGSRKATGSYYTPTKVVKKLCEHLFLEPLSAEKKVLDPCCGTGNFILQLPHSIDYKMVYGNDLDPLSVKISRINYALKYEISDKALIYSHITEGDFLSFSNDVKFDFIIGNPPWGYEYSKEEIASLKKRFETAFGNNVESYDLFVEQALLNLAKGGVLSFVIPEAFLNVKAHTAIRQLLLRTTSFQYLEYLGNVFDKVQCPSLIVQIKNTKRAFSTKDLVINDGSRTFTIKKERSLSAACFSFTTTDEEYALIQKMDELKNKITLKDRADFALGIVTGNNKDYLSEIKTETNEVILRGSDLYKYRYKNTNTYIAFKPETFQQVAPTEYYRAEEKLLYRFICNQLVFAYDDQKTLSLNSSNILIPKIPGLSMKYILAILNSRILQFYFKKKFNSVKVLRSHIEELPIPRIEKEAESQILALVDLMLHASLENKILVLYEKIDSLIADLFELSAKEYELIKASMRGDNLFLS